MLSLRLMYWVLADWTIKSLSWLFKNYHYDWFGLNVYDRARPNKMWEKIWWMERMKSNKRNVKKKMDRNPYAKKWTNNDYSLKSIYIAKNETIDDVGKFDSYLFIRVCVHKWWKYSHVSKQLFILTKNSAPCPFCVGLYTLLYVAYIISLIETFSVIWLLPDYNLEASQIQYSNRLLSFVSCYLLSQCSLINAMHVSYLLLLSGTGKLKCMSIHWR